MGEAWGAASLVGSLCGVHTGHVALCLSLFASCLVFCGLAVSCASRSFAHTLLSLSIANPPQGTQKKFLIDDEQKMKLLHDHRIAEELKGDFLGDQFKGYIFKITGGQDKQVGEACDTCAGCVSRLTCAFRRASL